MLNALLAQCWIFAYPLMRGDTVPRAFHEHVAAAEQIGFSMGDGARSTSADKT